MRKSVALFASVVAVATGTIFAPAVAYAGENPAPSCVSRLVHSGRKVVDVYNNCYDRQVMVHVHWDNWQDSYCKILNYREQHQFRTAFGSYDGVYLC